MLGGGFIKSASAKIAEREIFLKGQLDKAAQKGDFEEMQQLEQQLTRDKRTLQAEMEEKKEKARNKK